MTTAQLLAALRALILQALNAGDTPFALRLTAELRQIEAQQQGRAA